MVDYKTGIYIFLLYFFAAVAAAIAMKSTGDAKIIWSVVSLAILALAIYFSIYPDKLALRSYEDPDRHPFQDIPGQEIIPGEQLYA